MSPRSVATVIVTLAMSVLGAKAVGAQESDQQARPIQE